MKKRIFLPLLIIGGLFFTAMECEPEESCEQDEICEAKSVTACCTDDSCVYKYNGKEYTEDQVGELAEELGCGGTSGVKSAGNEDLTAIIEQLKALMEKARIK